MKATPVDLQKLEYFFDEFQSMFNKRADLFKKNLLTTTGSHEFKEGYLDDKFLCDLAEDALVHCMNKFIAVVSDSQKAEDEVNNLLDELNIETEE
ncbi:MAG TPA: hypothetical protein PLJ00_05780 [Chitinophagales bacterium]|nr:hypothetical protein [Chitinophagales bacterium]